MPLIQLQKAMIREKSNPLHMVRCAFNPTKFSIQTSAEWRRTPTRGATEAPAAGYVGPRPRTLTISELHFDGNWMDYFRGGGDVKRDVDQLLTWVNPVQGATPPNPPILVFTWGLETYFDCYLSSVTVNYEEFNPLGSVTRATVSVTLSEIPSDPPPTNPTSGGPAGRRTHMVAAGDTLHSIAQREYGKPALWRGLAEANGIDDPLRVAVGTSVLIPPREDVEDKS
jgi:nucleoid-associated protein YgaU